VWFYAAAWPAREPMSRTGLCVTMGISAVLLTGLAGLEINGFWSLISGPSLMTLGGVLVHIGRPILTFNFVQFYLVWVVGLGLLGTTVGTASRLHRRCVRFLDSPGNGRMDDGRMDHRSPDRPVDLGNCVSAPLPAGHH
jgi:hypothetical protein